MSKDVKNWFASCETCSRRKLTQRAVEPPLITLPTVNNLMDRVSVDFCGPFPITPDGKKYILVFMDYLTRWPEAFATKNMKAVTVAKFFVTEILCRHGAPIQLLSDQGRDFLAAVIQEIYIFTKTSKIQTAAYHPQTNGLCERFNGTLCQMLSLYTKENQSN